MKPSLPPDSELDAMLARFREERKTLAFVLVGGERLEGAIRWYDGEAIHIVTPNRDEVTLFRHGILYFRLSR
ncbi:MAG: hypothetical protein SFU56_09665 [Capsulimonadales bacterium]|nr:hypothetical protein [Capsulimonadales bacterium]